MSKNKGKNVKYLIVGTGRNGSSLLSAILNGAGADYGIEFKEDWDPRSGAFEQDNLHEAYKWYSRAKNIKESNIPEFFGYNFCDQRCNRYLKNALQKANFLKSSKLIWLVHKTHYELDYPVKIIGLYRKFSNYVVSRYKKFGGSFEKWRKTYMEVNKQLLLYRHVYDTELISYENLVNLKDRACVKKLSNFTDIDEDELNKFRNEIVKEGITKMSFIKNIETKSTKLIYKTLRK